jgi:Amt family ammonium transporter
MSATTSLDSAVTAQIEFYVDSVFFKVRDHALRTSKDLDVAWIVITSIVAFFVLAGMNALQAGYVHPKNVANVLFKNVICVSVAAICWWLLGYGVAFGPDAAGFIGSDNFALSDVWNGVSSKTKSSKESCVQQLATFSTRKHIPGCNWRGSDGWEDWFLQFVFACFVTLISAGAVSERTCLSAYLLFTVALTCFIYPVVVHWAWGFGWLSAWTKASALRETFGANNGLIDLGGSGVVHIVGGLSSLVGALLIGPRAGRFDEEGKPRELFAGNATLQTLGTLLLWVGFYGLTCGSTGMLSRGGSNTTAFITVNMSIAAASSTLACLLITRVFSSRYDFQFILQGTLGGLVAMSAGAHVLDPWMALIVGILAAVLVYAGNHLLLKLHIDDVCGTAVCHGVCGVWGLWAVGIFCNDKNVLYAGYPTNEGACRSAEQFGIQVATSLAIITWTCGTAAAAWLMIYLTVGLRVSYDDEESGLDIVYHGVRMTHVLHKTEECKRDLDEQAVMGNIVFPFPEGLTSSARAAAEAKAAAIANGRAPAAIQLYASRGSVQSMPVAMAEFQSPAAGVPSGFQLVGQPIVPGRPQVNVDYRAVSGVQRAAPCVSV